MIIVPTMGQAVQAVATHSMVGYVHSYDYECKCEI